MKKGTCQHFTGMMQKTCLAGVNYRTHVGGPDLGWGCRMPCILKYAENPVPCSLYSEPTQDQIEEYETKINEMTKRMRATFPLVARIKKEHRGTSWQGSEECPVCKGVLHLSHSGYNGHVWGKCDTKGCVAWVE